MKNSAPVNKTSSLILPPTTSIPLHCILHFELTQQDLIFYYTTATQKISLGVKYQLNHDKNIADRILYSPECAKFFSKHNLVSRVFDLEIENP